MGIGNQLWKFYDTPNNLPDETKVERKSKISSFKLKAIKKNHDYLSRTKSKKGEKFQGVYPKKATRIRYLLPNLYTVAPAYPNPLQGSDHGIAALQAAQKHEGTEHRR